MRPERAFDRASAAVAALIVTIAMVAGCGPSLANSHGNAGTTSDGNPLGPSYVLVPLPTEDDILLGRMLPEMPQAGHSLEETARANPCADKLTERKETPLASTFDYAEELQTGAKAEALLGAFGFSADGQRATHFVYKLSTERRVGVADTAGYDACCKEKGCGYGYISALIHGDGEYATGEETAGTAGVKVMGIGSASGNVALHILSKRKVKGWVAAVITVTDKTKGGDLGPLGIAQAAGITDPGIPDTVRTVYDGEKLSVQPSGDSYVFIDGRGHSMTENQFAQRYRATTGTDELDAYDKHRHVAGAITYGIATALMIGGTAAGAVLWSKDVQPGGVVLVALCSPGVIGFGIPFIAKAAKVDSTPTDHSLEPAEAEIAVSKYNRAKLRQVIRDVQKAQKSVSIQPVLGPGFSGVIGSF